MFVLVRVSDGFKGFVVYLSESLRIFEQRESTRRGKDAVWLKQNAWHMACAVRIVITKNKFQSKALQCVF